MPKDAKSLPAGQLAARAGCNVETLRYYERVGLMPEPPRSAGGHRQYAHAHLQRLYFIRRGRELGFSVQQVRGLLRLVDEPDHTCGEVREMARSQRAEVQQRIDDLMRLRDVLDDLVGRCGGGREPVAHCPILETLFAGSSAAGEGGR